MFEKKSRQKKLHLSICTNFIKKKTEVIFSSLFFCFDMFEKAGTVLFFENKVREIIKNICKNVERYDII